MEASPRTLSLPFRGVINMLSTDLALLVIGLIAVCVVWVAISQVNLRKDLETAIDFVRNHNAKSLSLRKIAEVEVALTELTDSYDALLSSHRKLRSRIGMREVREKRKNGDDRENEVDLTDEAQKAAYKARMRADLRKRGML